LKKEGKLLSFLAARHGMVTKHEEDGSEVLFLSGKNVLFFICSDLQHPL